MLNNMNIKINFRSTVTLIAFSAAFTTTTLTSCINPLHTNSIDTEFHPGVVISPSLSTVTVASSTITSGASIAVTISLRDTNNAAYISQLPTITLQATGGTSTGTFSAVTNNGDSTYSALFTGITSGTATSIQATVNDQLLTSDAPTVTVTHLPTPSQIIVIAGNSPTQSGNTNTPLGTPFKVKVQDASGNPISGILVDWAVTAGGGSLSSSANLTDSNGYSTSTLTLGSSHTSAGGNTIKAMIDSNPALTATFSATTNITTFSPFNWPFTSGSDANYSCVKSGTTYAGASGLNQCNLDITSNLIELSAASQTDNNDNTTGFGGGTTTGNALWDGANAYVRLSASPTPNLELDSSWTPAWTNIVGYWKLNEAAGATSVADSGPVGTNTGTPVGTTTFGATGALNTALSLSATGYIDVGNSAGVNLSGSLTLSAWVNISSFTAGWQPIVAKGDSSYRIQRYGGNNTITFATSGLSTADMASNSAVADGKWHHLVTVYNAGGSPNKLIYIDGLLDKSGTYTGTLSTNSIHLTIGANLEQGAPHFNGSIDDVALWNTALSASAVNTIYQHQSAKYTGTLTSRVMDGLSTGQSWTTLGWTTTLPFFKSLPDAGSSEISSSYSSMNANLMSGIVGLWHFDEAKGTTGSGSVKDKSGQGSPNNGTPSGSITFGASGKLGGSANFSGGYIDVGTLGSLGSLLGSGISASTWFRTTSTSKEAIFGEDDGGGSNYGHQIGLQLNQLPTTGATSTGALRFHLGDITNATYLDCGSTANLNITDGNWHHLVITMNPTSGTCKLFIDGSSKTVTYGHTGTPSSFSNLVTHLYLGAWNESGAIMPFSGNLDEFAIWNRILGDGTSGSANEILELYRRGANRLMYQVRTCTANNCSDDSAGANWKGPDGTTQTYFSELYNTTNNYLPTLGATPTPTPTPSPVLTGLPMMTFSNFPSPTPLVSNNRYFQYRAILETDDTNTLCNYGAGANTAPCSPELQSVTVGPTHYDGSSPAIYGLNGQSYYALSTFTETLGASSCPAGATYNVSPGLTSSGTWYWWNSVATMNCAATAGGTGAWCPADGTSAKSNSASVINTQLPSFSTQTNTGTGTAYFKAYLNSNGTQACQIDNLAVQGTQ